MVTRLAAAAGVNLGLDDADRPAEAFGDVVHLFGGEGDFSTGHGHPVLREDGLGLILVDFHVGLQGPVYYMWRPAWR